MSFSVVDRARCRRFASYATQLLLVVFLAACSATPELADGPYANCTDLGDLALLADSRADAEQRMSAQVRELGGDLLLFGERPRSEGISTVPEEIVERRNRLTSAEFDEEQPGFAEVSREASAEVPDESEWETGEIRDEQSQTGDRGRPRRGGVSVEPITPAPGPLWYYGAALRCNR